MIKKLKIKYKFSNAVVCVEDTGIEVILGNPFTVLSEPFTINDEGLHTNLKGKKCDI